MYSSTVVTSGSGAILHSQGAVAARHEDFGILQVDAHCDLREAYEGLRTSHASVMRRALELPQVSRLVQIGVRDFALAESAFTGWRWCPPRDSRRVATF